ncbi:MAG: DUF885 domain-containing protein [Tahibacter sp.]
MLTEKRVRLVSLAIGVAAALAGCASSAPRSNAKAVSVTELADRYVAAIIALDPTITYFTGVPVPAHDRLAGNSAAAIAEFSAQEDALLKDLATIDEAALVGTPDWKTFVAMKEGLESDRGLRVCHQEGWSVSHMGGWQVTLPQTAEAQPVGTPLARKEALTRWSGLEAYLDNDITNLRHGLEQGYAAPKSVVNRVLQQLDGILSASTEESPFYSPAARDDDAAFKREFAQLLTDRINPAIRHYREFLANEYLPRARDTLALSALPDGERCYAAQLRAQTTLTRSPREVYELGQRTVAANEAHVAELGQRLFGTSDIKTIIKKVDDAPANHFASEQALFDFSRSMLVEAREKSAALFATMPSQDAVVEPVPDYQRGSGVNASYEPNPDASKPGVYRIALEEWKKQTQGAAEVTLVHETWPGHHLQIAFARSEQAAHVSAKLSFNAAYVEGWARYAERLADEVGIYRTDYARISQRIWPARGMVVDPGIHLFGWSRKQAVDYLVASGRFNETTAEATVDRIAVMPAQLTAYDSGGLEIMALRAEAEKALGARFDLREFHSQVLEHGMVPLPALRTQVETWVRAKLSQR